MSTVKIRAARSGSSKNAAPKNLKKPTSAFGGFRKRTMTARQLVVNVASFLPDVGMLYQIWVKHELDPGFREELMLAVSRLNDCRFCTWGHHEWANMLGVTDEELAHVEQLDPADFDRKKWVAISYVREFVTANFGRVPAELRRELKANYTEREIKEIELVAKVMDLGNRGGNTWDAMLSRAKGVPAADSRIFDEIILSGVFWAVAPVVLVFLARSSKRPIIEVVRSVIDYTKHYEEKKAAAVPIG